jgi:hypothetical protein
MDPQLSLTVHPNGQGAILSVGGEVDLATAPQLQAKLMELVEVKEAGGVVVDLTPVVFMGSTGLACSWPGTGAHKRTATPSGWSALRGRCFVSCG